MEQNKYVAQLKELISSKASAQKKHSSITLEFYDDLFPDLADSIRSIANLLNYPEVDETTLKSYFEVAKKEYISVNPVQIEPARALTRDGYTTWLSAEREEKIDWNYSDRYIKLLEKSGRAETVVREANASSLDILSKLGDPKSVDGFYVKGLVVGEVQSGKTANFNGVINRAIDSGYKLIIVLSGIMEDLRIQTQQRIESDVIGEGIDIDTETKGVKGVGTITRFGYLGNSPIEQVVSITSYKSDFKKGLADADFSPNHTNILVCKKNIGVLKNLIVWIHDFLENDTTQHNIPLLILDDEADNASLNNEGHKGNEYASKINSHIRGLLQLFHKKTYLGYTATPFANVLQDRNDASRNGITINYKDAGVNKSIKLDLVPNIFPDDFIVLLTPPTNYIGAKQIFETVNPIKNKLEEKIPLVVSVEDSLQYFPSRVTRDGAEGVENYPNKQIWDERVGEYNSYLDYAYFRDYRRETRASRKDDNFPRSLPTSLEDSLLCFLLAIAVRESRKPMMIQSVFYQPHNTMLIHVSRFTAWQNTTRSLIDIYMSDLKTKIDNDLLDGPDSVYALLERKWYEYYGELIESIRDYLPNGYIDEFLVPITFNSLKKYFPDILESIDVRAINSTTGEKLIYPKNRGKNVIAIGGNRLSRGFTLEGLTINYFVRATDYSDTLLQMGRWFGYRPGYLDCCKVFVTPDSIDKYNSTTRCIEELEMEFHKMDDQKKTPEKYVVRVKKHPGVLKITRPTILRNTVTVRWSFQDSLEMTTQFDINRAHIEKVWSYFKSEFVPKLNKGQVVGDFITFKANADVVIELLRGPSNYSDTDAELMTRFISLCNSQGKGLLSDWTVALRTVGRANSKVGKGVLSKAESGLIKDVGLAVRRGPSDKAAASLNKDFLDKYIFRATGKSANILSSNNDMSLLLTDEEKNNAERDFISSKTVDLKRNNPTKSNSEIQALLPKTFPERIYRERMKENEGLIVIYLFDSYYSFNQEKGKEVQKYSEFVEQNGYNLDIPLVGLAIGFPPIQDDPGGEYVRGDYDLNEDDEEPDEINDEDSILPSIEE